MLRFLNLRKGAGVLFAGVRPGLEGTEPVRDNCQKDFLRYAVNASLINRTILEKYHDLRITSFVPIRAFLGGISFRIEAGDFER